MRRSAVAVVVDGGERTDDIVRDLHEVIVSMCARLYGKGAVKNPAKRAAMEAIECEECGAIVSRWFLRQHRKCCCGPSSKLCSACGPIAAELPLSIREWRCECGAWHDPGC